MGCRGDFCICSPRSARARRSNCDCRRRTHANTAESTAQRSPEPLPSTSAWWRAARCFAEEPAGLSLLVGLY
jgi:hypothetical protein